MIFFILRKGDIYLELSDLFRSTRACQVNTDEIYLVAQKGDDDDDDLERVCSGDKVGSVLIREHEVQ